MNKEPNYPTFVKRKGINYPRLRLWMVVLGFVIVILQLAVFFGYWFNDWLAP